MDFFQYRKSQADSQAVFQAVFFPSGSDPRSLARLGNLCLLVITLAHLERVFRWQRGARVEVEGRFVGDAAEAVLQLPAEAAAVRGLALLEEIV